MSVVVSVRIPKHVKEVLDRHGINISELVKKVLVEEARRLEEEELWDNLEEVVEEIRSKFDPLEWAKLVEEDRRLR